MTDPLAYVIAETLDQALERHIGSPVADRQWLARTCLEITQNVHRALSEHPAELVEVPGLNEEQFEAFKTRWQDALGGVTVEEACRYYEANKHLLQGGAIDWPAAIAYFEDMSFDDPSPSDATWHAYRPTPDVPVKVCIDCGKWPMHHSHQGITADLCTCDDHRNTP